MSTKVLLFCLLATLAAAQDMENNTLSMERIAELRQIQANYDQAVAASARRSHLFCLTRTTTEDGEVTISEFEQNGANVWTLFFQMPLITFLDPQRKLSLMDTVMKVLNNNGMDIDDICLGTYETYELSYFKESVLIRVYSSSSTPINAEQWSTMFNDAVVDQQGDNNGYVITYPGQSNVIALNFSTSNYYRGLIQPVSETSDGVDLTSLAVFIGSYGFNYSFTDHANTSVSRNINSVSFRAFAANTNPINYGLEAGDIVFAVFGSILLVIVGGLTILGYCIHPFFLA